MKTETYTIRTITYPRCDEPTSVTHYEVHDTTKHPLFTCVKMFKSRSEAELFLNIASTIEGETILGHETSAKVASLISDLFKKQG